MITQEQILKLAKFITSYDGYNIYRLGNLLLKHDPKTKIITGTVLTEGEKANAS